MTCSNTLHRSMLILLTIITAANGRTWTNINIAAIDEIKEMDPLLGSSSQLAMEDMSFLFDSVSAETNIKLSDDVAVSDSTFATPTPSIVPSASSSNEPSNAIYSSDVTSAIPSSNPSASIDLATIQEATNTNETTSPTWSPSAQYQTANKNCNNDETLYRLVTYESIGGGSSAASLVIKETNTSKVVIETKAHNSDNTATNSTSPVSKTAYLCLKQTTCYTAEFINYTLVGGMSWELHHVVLAAGIGTILVVAGTGDEDGCQFGLGGACVTSCHGEFKDDHLKKDPETPSPQTHFPKLKATTSPSYYPIQDPTPSPTWKRTRRPTTPAPSIYLPQDKEVSYGSSRYKALQSIILAASPDSKDALDDDASPQNTALVWLYNSDNKLSDTRVLHRWVLAAFYYGLNGDEWFNRKGWLSANNHECDWYGLTCIDGVVTQISLEENRMVGEMVPELALLKDSLYYLSLGNNYDTPKEERNVIAAPVPSFLGDLHHLSYLNLEGIGLASTIPKNLFSKWTRLESLYLNDNDMTGTLPSSIANLDSIKVLWMGGNNLGGSIISEIGQLMTLIDLSLESNFREDVPGKRGFMTGLPSSMAQLTRLEMLDLSDNSLSGTVPIQLAELISLRRLDLSNNFFEKQLPIALGNLQMLEVLDISFNWLSSTIPKEYGDMISLTSLSLESNYKDQNGYFAWGIHGKLPTELGKLKNLEHLHLNDNYITGTLITEIGQLYFLKTLHLQSNFLLGPIPSEYSNCVSLEELLLEENNIDGSLFGMPEKICRLPELELARVDCKVACSCCYGC